MISNNGTTTPIADATAVVDASKIDGREIAQDTLRQVAESVRSAFPRPSDACELVLIDVDPHHVHAFWNVPPAAAAGVRSALGLADDSAPLVLRMTEILPDGERGEAFDIEVVGLQGQYYVDIWGDARRYQADVGLRRRDGSMAPFTRSNIVVLPAAAPSADHTWREIALPAPPASPPPPARPLPHLATAASAGAPLPSDSHPDAPANLPSPAERDLSGAAAMAATVPPAPYPDSVTPPAAIAPAASTDATVVSQSALPPGPPPAGGISGPDQQRQHPSIDVAPPASPTIAVKSVEVQPVEMAAGWTEGGEAVPVAAPAGGISATWTGHGEAPPVIAPALEVLVAPASEAAPPSAEAETAGIASAIAAHEREAVAPLAPFPYYEPESEGPSGEPPPPEPSAAETSGDVAATSETAASGEGPEPVPLPLENVLSLSSFAVAGGAVEFEINAELHIFGRAKPGLKLQLFGRPVTIRPDGTFSINRPLPNGALVLSVLLAKNGEREE